MALYASESHSICCHVLLPDIIVFGPARAGSVLPLPLLRRSFNEGTGWFLYDMNDGGPRDLNIRAAPIGYLVRLILGLESAKPR